jgi:hypothetical protein
MAIISVEGFYDTHVHSAPAPFRRIGDTVDIARWCADAGMAGIVVKSHFEATIAKAHHARKEVPGFAVFAGIALNRGVGGINPASVEQALSQDAKVVWFPTIDSQNHARVFGAVGTFGFASMTLKESRRVQEQYTVLEGGKLSADAKEVINLVGAYDAVLETGHIDRAEILAVVDYAVGKGLKKILITHAEYAAPKLDIDTQIQLAKAGCFLEYCAGSCMPMQHMVIPEEIKAMIDAVTPERAVIATDSGQPFHAKPPDQFRLFAQTLHELGVTEESIKQMAIKNPAYLLGVTTENR